MKKSYREKVKKLLEDAEKALQAQAWTSAANSYDSAIEGMLRPHLKNKYHVNVGYNWRKVPEELRSKGVEVEESWKQVGRLRFKGKGWSKATYSMEPE
ncbi:MAG: hypothetical protein QXO32_02680 [Candidatus Bathyarchaeia archaeon]